MELQREDAVPQSRGAVIDELAHHVTIDAVNEVVAVGHEENVVPIAEVDQLLQVGAALAEPLGESGPDLKKLINLGDWNNVLLVANGNHLVYSINGHVMSELIDDSPAALRDGVLALQLHAGFTMDVRFKDVRIKMLR